MSERDYSQLQPTELNDEYHKLFGLLPAIEISMAGTITGSDSLEMDETELPFYQRILQDLKDLDNTATVFGNPYAGMTLEEIDARIGSSRNMFIQQAKGAAAMARRMTFGATILVKLEDFTPYVKGTDSFKEYMCREMRRCIRDGTRDGGRGHWLYGDDILGGVFHPQAVEPIEEKSFQIFSQDIAWYGLDPMGIMGRLFDADYDNDPNYREIVDLGRAWKPHFLERYGRVPIDLYGQEIQIP